MLTIDWKERFTLDTEDYLKNKLPQGDYDFEIIFNAYPERVNGKIPAKVLTFISGIMVSRLGKKHAEYIDFYRHLWMHKGESGKIAFASIMAKLTNKKPEVYLPLIEEMVPYGNASTVNMLLDRVMLALTRKYPDKYLNRVINWTKDENQELAKAATNLCLKLIKREEELIPRILHPLQNQWNHPLEERQLLHVHILRAVAKISWDAYLKVWEEFGISRDPQIAELLSASLSGYDPMIEEMVSVWAKSGNAKVKRAGLAAQKVLKKKKGAKA